MCRTVLSRETVSAGWKVALHELQKVSDEPYHRGRIQAGTWEELPRAVRERYRGPRFVLPEPPNLQALELAFILRPGNEIVHAQEVAPTQGWIDAYKTYKSRGHVFPSRAHVRDVFAATEGLLAARYGLPFRADLVGKLCHWA
jgi:hypothetical protein